MCDAYEVRNIWTRRRSPVAFSETETTANKGNIAKLNVDFHSSGSLCEQVTGSNKSICLQYPERLLGNPMRHRGDPPPLPTHDGATEVAAHNGAVQGQHTTT